MKEILIVEDDEILSRTLAHRLRADGWKVAEAGTAAHSAVPTGFAGH